MGMVPARLVRCALIWMVAGSSPAPWCVSAQAAAGDGEWSRVARRHNPIPVARADHELVYDPVGDQFIVLGGRGALHYDPVRLLGDVWAIPGEDPRWAPFWASGDALPARWSRVAVLDPPRRRLIVFGGYDDRAETNEVWSVALDPPRTIRREFPTGTPPTPRFHTSAVYDAVRERMLVFGGAGNGFSSFSNDVWALSLNGELRWTPVATSGTPPRARAAHGAIYHPVLDRMLVFGGTDSSLQRRSDTWELTLGNPPTWRQLTGVGSAPSLRGMDLAYDSLRDRILLHGDDFIAYSGFWALPLGPGGTWSRIDPPCCQGASFYDRAATRIAYDTLRDRLVVVGGKWSDDRFLNDAMAFDLHGPAVWSELIRNDANPVVEPSSYYYGPGVYDPGVDRVILWTFAPFGFEGWSIAVTDSANWTPERFRRGAGLTLSNPGVAFHDPDFGRVLALGRAYGTATIVQALSLATGRWDSLATFYDPDMVPGPANTVFDRDRHRILVYGGGCCPGVNATWAIGLDPATGRVTGFQRLPTDGLHPAPGGVLATTLDGPRARMLLLRLSSGGPQELWALSMGSPPTWSPLTVAPDPQYGVPPTGTIGPTLYDPRRDRWLVTPQWALIPGGSPRWDALGPFDAAPSSARFMEYDPINERVVVVADGADVWVWRPGAAPPPPARTITVASISSDTQSVRIEWSTNEPQGLSATVYRSNSPSVWVALGPAIVDPSGAITYVDATVSQGVRYTYRLGIAGSGGETFAGEASITVPTGPGPGPGPGPPGPSIASIGARPNPATGFLKLALALPGDESARVEVLDSGGRLVWSGAVRLGRGEYVILVDPPSALRNGVYLVRLRQGAYSAQSKAVLIR